MRCYIWYRCRDCGDVRPLPPETPQVIDAPCCVAEPDGDRWELSRHDRID